MPKTSNNPELAMKLAKDFIEVEMKKPLYIEYVPIEDIYPNDYNNNQHSADSFDLLVKSILYLGFTQPIVVNRRDMKIIDGENRYRAACVIGYKLIPVCFQDWDEEKTKYATIMHNMARGSENGEQTRRLYEYLDSHFSNNHEKVLLKDRKK